MLKKSSTTTSLQTNAVKQDVQKELKVEVSKVVESQKVRPGSFAALISQ